MSERPLPPAIVLDAVNRIRALPLEKLSPLSPNYHGVCTGLLDTAAQGKEGRYRVLLFLFPDLWESLEDVTSKGLGTWEWISLYRWIRPAKPTEDMPWSADPSFNQEVAWILADVPIPIPIAEASGREYNPGPQTAQALIDSHGGMPVMECGHDADGVTALGNPFCWKCSDAGSNKKAYEVREVIKC